MLGQDASMANERIMSRLFKESILHGRVPASKLKLLYDINNRELFFRIALANRLLLHSFDILIKSGIRLSSKEYEKYKFLEKRHNDSIMTLYNAYEALENAGVEYAVIKTIRNYRTTTVDIDVYLLRGREELKKSIIALKNNGFINHASGPGSVTLVHPKYNVAVDLYVEISASRIRYCPDLDDKGKIDKATIKSPVLTFSVPVLGPEYEFLVIGAHSLVKEQMFTLADYLMLTDKLSKKSIKKVYDVAEELSCKYSLHYSLNMMHKTLYGNFDYPIKVKPVELLLYLGEAFLESNFIRKSIVWQLSYLLRFSRATEFAAYIVEHALRETY